jgi:hypothetical protein
MDPYATLGDPDFEANNADQLARMKRRDERVNIAHLVQGLPVAPGFGGWQTIGANLFGGHARREAAYDEGASERVSSFRGLEEARAARARAMAREALPRLVQEAGVPHPELAAAILQMASGQPNLGTVTGGLVDMSNMELARQQEEALSNGDVKLANQLRAVRADKDYEPVRAVDGNLIPSATTLGDPDFKVQPLPQTQARIAVADAQRQKALRPPAAHAHTGHGAAVKPEDAELASARAALQAGAKRDAVISRLKARGFGHLTKKL